MAFAYADYDSQSTDAARLARVNLFLAELRLEMAKPAVGHGASSRSNAAELSALFQQAAADRDKYEGRVKRGTTGTNAYGGFGR